MPPTTLAVEIIATIAAQGADDPEDPDDDASSGGSDTTPEGDVVDEAERVAVESTDE